MLGVTYPWFEEVSAASANLNRARSDHQQPVSVTAHDARICTPTLLQSTFAAEQQQNVYARLNELALPARGHNLSHDM
jgi:hypothetical protein